MSRNIALDILKLIMAFMVVGAHTRFLLDVSPLAHHLGLNGVFRIAVPVFTLITGFFFYQVVQQQNQATWFKRIFILYAIWMLVYSPYWFFVPEFSLGSISWFMVNIIFGYHHLWYIAGVIGAAIVLHLLREQSSGVLLASVLVLYVIGVVIQYLGNYRVFADYPAVDQTLNYLWFHRNFLWLSYPFFCMGYLIKKHSLIDRFSIQQACGLSVIAFIVLMAESYFNFHAEDLKGPFDNYLSVLMVGPLVFIAFMKANIAGKSKEIALYASAIYFIHPVVSRTLCKFIEIDATPLTIATIVLSAAVSFFIVKLNNRTKYLL